MSKIVVLVGSVRKNGNTAMLAQAFADGAGLNHEVEILSMADYKINPCTGCNSCFQRENHACFQQDDMQKVYPILAAADIIMIASPVYFYGVSAQLKALIDRLHTPLRNTFRVQKLGLLLVGASPLPAVFDAIKVQYRLILDFFKLEDVGSVMVREVKDIGDMKGNAALAEACELGKSLR